MFIDIAYIVVLFFAVLKGLRRGLIIGFFSTIAFIIGLAAALKLAAVVAVKLRGSVHEPSRWWPVLSFILVFAIVVWLVRLLANFLDATVKLALLGWLNRLCGAIFYIFVYTIIFSAILFFVVQLGIINEVGIARSRTYRFVQPAAPWVMDSFAKLLPFLKNMFTELQDFFESVSKRLSH